MASLEQSQRAFTAQMRASKNAAADRRTGAYRSLVFNNIASFIRNGFPVARKVLGDAALDRLISAFVAEHRATTPYFLEIGAEFLAFLQQQPKLVSELPDFLFELLAWEHLELVLDVAEERLPSPFDPALLGADSVPLISPLASLMVCRYPVHQVSADSQSAAPAAQPVCLVAYRDREDAVRFVELNPLGARLLELLEPGELSVAGAAQCIANESGTAVPTVLAAALDALRQWAILPLVIGVARG